jgi:hypothetical protein
MRHSQTLGLGVLALISAGVFALLALQVFAAGHGSRPAQAALPATASPSRSLSPTMAAAPPRPASLGDGLASAVLAQLRQALAASPAGQFQSANISVIGPGGEPVALHATGGTVRAADSSEVAILPNGGGDPVRFSVVAATSIVDGPNRANALDLVWNTPVVVLTQPNSTRALAVIALSALSGAASPSATPPARAKLPTIRRPTLTPTRVP